MIQQFWFQLVEIKTQTYGQVSTQADSIWKNPFGVTQELNPVKKSFNHSCAKCFVKLAQQSFDSNNGCALEGYT